MEHPLPDPNDPSSMAEFPELDAGSLLLDEVPDYLWSAALRGGELVEPLYSPGVEAFTGCTPEQHAADQGLWFAHIHPDDRARVVGTRERLLLGQPTVDEYRIIHEDGTYRWIRSLIRPTLQPGGEVVHLEGVVTDVTHRRIAEARGWRRGRWLSAVRRIAAAVNSNLDLIVILETTVEQLWRVMPAARMVIVRFSPDGEEATVVAACGSTEGFRRLKEKFTPGPYLRELWQSRRQHYVAAFEAGESVFQGSACYVPVCHVEQCVAALVVYRAPGQGLDEEDRDFLDTVGTHVSIAVHNASLMEDLRIAQRTAVELARARTIGEVTAGVAHDFNNLLAAILGNAQLALQSSHLPSDARRRLLSVEQAALDGAAMIARVRRLAEPDVPLSAEPLDLAEICRDVIELLRPRWETSGPGSSRKITVVTQLEHAPSAGDATELRECTANLIYNSLLAMPQGGELTVRSGVSGGQAWFEVADTGVGIPPDTQARMWEPYFTTRAAGSSGLGLAVCQRILQRHAALVDVESEVGKGTTIRCGLPLLSGIGSRAAEVERATDAGSDGARVLVVDDDPMVLDVHSLALERQGFQVVTAASAEEARALLETAECSIAVLDHRMPGTSGTELAAMIESRWPGVPVILLTGLGDEARADICSNNVQLVLGKPVGLRDLAKAVASLLKD